MRALKRIARGALLLVGVIIGLAVTLLEILSDLSSPKRRRRR
ncbi:hypothetical protein [Sphingomonas trueperi]